MFSLGAVGQSSVGSESDVVILSWLAPSKISKTQFPVILPFLGPDLFDELNILSPIKLADV